jgi:hypothetical protein
MKVMAASFLAVVTLGCSAMAQQPQITGFSADGMLTWTNAQTNVYCGIEVSWNLNESWQGITAEPPYWNLQPTQIVTSVTVADFVQVWPMLQVAFSNLGENAKGMYFRVVSSPTPLVQPLITNGVHLTNASETVLSNVTIGLKQNWSYSPLTNLGVLAQSVGTSIMPVWKPRVPFFSQAQAPFTNLSPAVGGVVVVEDGWYVAYDQAGSNRVVEMFVVDFGQPERNFFLTVSNSSVTMEAEWLGRSRTVSY